MATYNPPTEDLVIFDSSVFHSVNGETITPATLDANYLKYPIGQGTETLPNLVVGGSCAVGGDINFSDGLGDTATIGMVSPNLAITASGNVNIKTISTTQNASHYFNISDNSATGVGPIQKSANFSCNPSTGELTVNGPINFKISDDNSAGTYYIPFTKGPVGTAGQLYVDSTIGPLTYNPNTSTMTLTAIEAPTATSPTVLRIGNNLTSGRLDLANNGGATSVWILGGAASSFCSVRGNLSVQYRIITSTGTSGSPTGKTDLGYVFPLITGGWDTALTTSAKVLNTFTLDGTNIAYGSYKLDVNINLASNGASNNNMKFWITTGSGNTTLVAPICQYYGMAGQSGGGCFFSQTIAFYAASGSQIFNVCGILSAGTATLTTNGSTEASTISLTRCA
jgi:hypothetical protein